VDCAAVGERHPPRALRVPKAGWEPDGSRLGIDRLDQEIASVAVDRGDRAHGAVDDAEPTLVAQDQDLVADPHSNAAHVEPIAQDDARLD
jgi:hypothetical protein